MRGPLLGLAVVLLAGCVAELLPVPATTGIAFICAVLDPEGAETLVVQSWIGEGVDVDRGLAISTLQAELVAMTGRDSEHVRAIERPGPPVPRVGWNDTTVRSWSEDQPFAGRSLVTLRVLWVETWGEVNQTGAAPVTGTIVLAQSGIRRSAEALNTTEAVVARAVLLHFVGHALGVVNRGVAVQDPDIQEREGPPGHDPDPASVLHVGWEDARTMAWAANATYDRYSDPLRRDWAAATEPGGACL